MSTFPRWARRLSAVALLLVGTAQIHAQNAGTLSILSGAEQQALAAEQARRQAAGRLLSASTPTLEGAVDPDAYIVGPGDVFSVSIGESLPIQLVPVVSADGRLVLPEMGSVEVAGLSLAQARTKAIAKLRGAYRNVGVEVALVQPRQFYVHVSGEVERPGRHVVVPVARVEDALVVAMAGLTPPQVLELKRREYWNYDVLPALRNIEIVRQSGERIPVDLMLYYATGDAEANPYLRDGDRLYVPAFRAEEAGVFVERESNTVTALDPERVTPRPRAELFDHRPGDTITTLLLVAGGPDLLAQTERARLLRTEDDGTLRTVDVDVAAIVAQTAADVPVQPLDRLLLPAPSVRQGVVQAEGFVAFPGSYPIVEGETTLRELLEAAGGIREDGLLRAAYLERRGGQAEQELPLTEAALRQATTRAQRREEDLFSEARLSDLPFTSRVYLAREVTEFQRVSLDLSAGLDALPSVPLYDGDRLVVPRDPSAILVVGQVRFPGYVPFKSGAGADHYIQQAGGTGPAATEVYLREAGSGTLQSPRGAAIRSGDTIFVDRIPTADTSSEQTLVLQEQRERANRRLQLVQAGLSVASTLATVVTTYLLIVRGN